MINESQDHPLIRKIADQRASLTPRGRDLADFVLQNPRKVMFMRTKELASVCRTSESTVVRFVSQLGYQGYSDFLQALRDFVDTELTLLERVELSNRQGPGQERFRRIVFEEVDNLKQLYETMNMETVEKVVEGFADESPDLCGGVAPFLHPGLLPGVVPDEGAPERSDSQGKRQQFH